MANTPTFAAVSDFSKIQGYVDAGQISYPSYIVCRNDWTWAFVDKDSSINHIRGYQQEAIIPVDTLPTEDVRTDAFYFCDGVGYLYINGSFAPVFKDVDSNISSYDQLTNVPVINKYGEITDPLVLADFDNGSYSVSGQYKIGGNLETIFVVPSNVLFLIDSDEEYKYITKLDPKKICQYVLNLSDNSVVKTDYATETWVRAQGYVTETFVRQAIEDLYNKIIKDLLITKVSQLENDCGYLTVDNFSGISTSDIANLF